MVPSLANAQSNVWSTRVKMLHPDINLTVLLPHTRTPPPAFPHDLAKFHVPLMSKCHANSCISVNKRFGSGRASPCPRPPGSDCLLPPGRSWKTPPVLLLPLLPPHTQSSTPSALSVRSSRFLNLRSICPWNWLTGTFAGWDEPFVWRFIHCKCSIASPKK